MAGSAIIEVVIGMIFVFIVLSILVQQINTIIAYVLNLRAKHLRNGLEQLIEDPVIRTKILAHPLINIIAYSIPSDTHMTAQQAEQATNLGATTNVEWIEPQTFVEALTRVLAVGVERQDFYGPLRTAVEQLPPSTDKSTIREIIGDLNRFRTNLPTLRGAIDALDDLEQRTGILAALDQVEQEVSALEIEPNDLATLLTGVRRITNPKFKDKLEAVLASAMDLEDARTKLAVWFDSSMDRVTAAYARRMQYLTIGIGAILVLLLNIDTFHLAHTLWNDSALRETIVSAAESRVENGLAEEVVVPTVTFIQPEVTPEAGVIATLAPAPAVNLGGVLTEGQEVATRVNALMELRLPIGWEFKNYRTSEEVEALSEVELLNDPRSDSRNLRNLFPQDNADWLGFILVKIGGLIATIVAVSQGAPFWFSIISRVINR